jgi:hypothetical protein
MQGQETFGPALVSGYWLRRAFDGIINKNNMMYASRVAA